MRPDKIACKSLSDTERTLLVMLAGRVIAQRKFSELGFKDPVAEKMAERLDVDIEQYTFDMSLMKAAVLRAKWFDLRTAAFFRAYPDGMAVSLGAGLSSAYYRVTEYLSQPNFDWIDIDMPQVIEIKRNLIKSGNHYHLIPYDITKEDWLNAVDWNPKRPIIIIMEGLIMYLTSNTGSALFKNIAAHFGAGEAPVELLFDYDSPAMIRNISLMTPAIASTGAKYTWPLKRAEDIIRFNPRYQILEEHNPWPQCGFRMFIISYLHSLLTLGRQVYGFVHAQINK